MSAPRWIGPSPGIAGHVATGALVPVYDLTVKTFGSGDDAACGPAFAPAVLVPGDAPLMDQILGLLGRDPAWKVPA